MENYDNKILEKKNQQKIFIVWAFWAAVILGVGLVVYSNFSAFGDTIFNTTLERKDLDDGLVLHYTFDGEYISDDTDEEIQDRTINALHGERRDLTNSRVVPGKIGQGFELSGTASDDVRLVDDTATTSKLQLQTYTASIWFKANSFDPDGDGDIDDLLEKGSGASLNYRILLLNSTNNRIQIRSNIDSSVRTHGTGVDPEIGKWYHVAISYDGNDLKGYVNGVEEVSASYPAGDVATGTETFYIGGGGGLQFDGVVDDVRVYERSLSIKEIEQLYHLGATTKISTSLERQRLDVGLAGHWTFDGEHMDMSSSTAEVLDRSVEGNNGDWVNHESTTVAGKIGQAVHFDGTNERVVVGTSNFASGSGADWSLTAWVNVDVLDSNPHHIIGYGDGTDGNTPHIGIDETDVWKVSTWGTPANDLDSTLAPVPGKWTHIVGTGSGTTLSLYINGVLSTTTTVTTNDPVLTRSRIGASSLASPGAHFEGSIDDVRVYNRVLPLEEIEQLYGFGATTKINKTLDTHVDLKNGLEVHYTYDGNDIDLSQSSTEIRDVSGNNRHMNWIDHASTTAIGAIGQALKFDATNADDYTSLDDDTLLNFGTTTDFTASFWMKTKQTTIAQPVWKIPSGEGGYLVRMNASGNIHANTTDGTNSVVGTADGPTINDGKWHHVVVNWSRTDDTVTRYIDGVQVGTVDDISTVTGSLDNTSTFRAPTKSSSLEDGFIDDLRMYSRNLSDEEVRLLYELGQ